MDSKATEVFAFIATAKNYVLVIESEQQVYIPDSHAPGGYNTMKKPGIRIRFEDSRYETTDPKKVDMIMSSKAFGTDIYLVDPRKDEDPRDKRIRELEEQLAESKPKIERQSAPVETKKVGKTKKIYTTSDGTKFDDLGDMRRHQLKLNSKTRKKAKK